MCPLVAVQLLSRVWLFVTPQAIAHQAPPSMGFSRQDYWSELPCPPPGDLPPNPGIKPGSLRSPALAGKFFTANANWEALDMLNILSWKSLRKTAETGRSRWPSSCPFPLKWVRKDSGERCLLVPGGKKHSYLLRQVDLKKNPDRQDLLSFPQFITLASHSLSYHSSS